MANDRTWFEIKAVAGSDPEILIYDYIGAYGVTAKDFNDQLKALGQPPRMKLRINSPGGEVFAGTAIFNMLDRHSAHITVVIDGVAASMASLIAMVGDEVIMPANAMLMIHNPMGLVVGTSKEMRDHADFMDKVRSSMVNTYAFKSGQKPEAIIEIMDAETWYTAQEAVDAGFADTVESPVQIAATFDLSKFKNPPEDWVVNRGPAASTEEAHMSTPTNAPAAVVPAPAPAAPIVAVAPAPVVPAPVATETQEQMTARITAEVNAASAARVNEITSLCALAKQPEKVAEFIASGKTPAEVLAALTAAPATPAPAAQHQLNTQLPAGGESDADRPKAEAIDTQAIYARYNTTGQKVAR